MAKVLQAIVILIIASRASLVTTEANITGSKSSATLTTAARADDRSSVKGSTTYTTVSVTTEATKQGLTESHRSTRHSTESGSHTSAAHSLSTSINEASSERHQPATITSSATGQRSESVTSSHGGNSVSDQTEKTVKNDSTGTILLKTTTFPLATVSTKNVHTTPTEAPHGMAGNNLARNPGLVAVLCIFFIVLALILVVVIAKVITTCRKSKFERLDDLPMGKMSEDSPFARYPAK